MHRARYPFHVMERMNWPLQVVLALLGGGLVGVLGTVIEQGVLYIGTFPLPWGLVLALALVLSYLLGLRVEMARY